MDYKTLVDKLAARLSRDKNDVQKLVDGLIDVIGNSCASLDSVIIPSFGQFEPKKKEERVAVHPGTGDKLLVPPKITVSFKPSALLKQKIREAK